MAGCFQNGICFQALYIDPKEPYAVHWPFKKGHLNLHDGPGGSLTAVCADLEVLWAHAIQTILDIPLRDLGVSIRKDVESQYAMLLSHCEPYMKQKRMQSCIGGSLYYCSLLCPAWTKVIIQTEDCGTCTFIVLSLACLGDGTSLTTIVMQLKHC